MIIILLLSLLILFLIYKGLVYLFACGLLVKEMEE
jgi:hypothetical protein